MTPAHSGGVPLRIVAYRDTSRIWPRGWWIEKGVRIYVSRYDTLYVVSSPWRPPFRVVVGGVLPFEIPAALDLASRSAEMALRKPVSPSNEGGGIIAWPLCDIALAAPTLFEWCTVDKWEDGSPRTPGSYSVFTQDGLWKMVIKDKDASRCLWVAAPTMTTLFGVAEAALNSVTADWRAERTKPGDQARRLPRKG